MAISNLTANEPSLTKSDSLVKDAGTTAPISTRRLTVSSCPAELRWEVGQRPSPPVPPPMPYVRMRGKWLARAGFAIGSAIRVSVAPGRLVLEVVNIKPPSKRPAQGDLWGV